MALTQHYCRTAVWAHNGLTGRSRMALQYLADVQQSPTTTPEAKELASSIAPKLYELAQLIRTRVDPEES